MHLTWYLVYAAYVVHVVTQDVKVEQVGIAEAAKRLGVAQDTIRRRIRKGDLVAYQEHRPQGYIWLVELPEDDSTSDPEPEVVNGSDFDTTEAPEQPSLAALSSQVEGQRRLIESLESQVLAYQQELTAKNDQIRELHVLLQQVQTALPVPREKRPWWHRLWPGQGSSPS